MGRAAYAHRRAEGSPGPDRRSVVLGCLRKFAKALYFVHSAMSSKVRLTARSMTHVVGAALPCLLALALFLDVAQAGQTYLYCLATQTVMSGPCCPPRAEQARGVSTIAAPTPECCELRVVQALAPCTFPIRSATLSAPVVAAITLPPAFVAIPQGGSVRDHADVMRTGPPPARARARLMVFLI